MLLVLDDPLPDVSAAHLRRPEHRGVLGVQARLRRRDDIDHERLERRKRELFPSLVDCARDIQYSAPGAITESEAQREYTHWTQPQGVSPG